MTTPQYDRKRLSEVRAAQAHKEEIQQFRAVQTVHDHATDAQDRAMLMDMLGLETHGRRVDTLH
ncbi:hypothetical protein [Kibdelosporangium phytohabitans]|uniref:Uncharacterized protein n=1 Tax=Kibdelosporangium phytohabitans TaxID=860235 RepID=A0A0N9I532_9PSEU|nr:hypothetical protein [Kibdelosporangium phytohabitans]ALG09769.1 hypothetical protein AOZ06_25275 [Kibdelosporangium phytohabitans]MBE1468857.1 hypothetical protein [Kibdelosporangium phytohabitans]